MLQPLHTKFFRILEYNYLNCEDIEFFVQFRYHLLSMIISFVRFVWNVNKISPPLKTFIFDIVNNLHFSFSLCSNFWKHKDHFLHSPHIYSRKKKIRRILFTVVFRRSNDRHQIESSDKKYNLLASISTIRSLSINFSLQVLS